MRAGHVFCSGSEARYEVVNKHGVITGSMGLSLAKEMARTWDESHPEDAPHIVRRRAQETPST